MGWQLAFFFFYFLPFHAYAIFVWIHLCNIGTSIFWISWWTMVCQRHWWRRFSMVVTNFSICRWRRRWNLQRRTFGSRLGSALASTLRWRNSSFGGTSSRCLRTLSLTVPANLKVSGTKQFSRQWHKTMTKNHCLWKNGLIFCFCSEVVQEYSKRSREVTMELLKAISESLGFEQSYIEKAMNLKSGFQLFAANLYPPCPQPELAMGIPAHTDHGLLTLLIENGIGGLQIQHNGTWFHVNPLPNSFLVNTADQLEVNSLSPIYRLVGEFNGGPTLPWLWHPTNKFIFITYTIYFVTRYWAMVGTRASCIEQLLITNPHGYL